MTSLKFGLFWLPYHPHSVCTCVTKITNLLPLFAWHCLWMVPQLVRYKIYKCKIVFWIRSHTAIEFSLVVLTPSAPNVLGEKLKKLTRWPNGSTEEENALTHPMQTGRAHPVALFLFFLQFLDIWPWAVVILILHKCGTQAVEYNKL